MLRLTLLIITLFVAFSWWATLVTIQAL